MILAGLVVAAAAAATAAPVECTQADVYTFRVVRPRNMRGADPGLQGLPVELWGSRRPVHAPGRVEQGMLTVCLAGLTPGDPVRPVPGDARPRVFEVLYPLPDTALTHDGQPTLVLCEQREDCDPTRAQAEEILQLYRERQQAARRIGELEGQLQAARAAGQRAAQLERELAEASAALRERGRAGELAGLLEFKAAQVAAARDASQLLSEYENVAQELSDRFRRHLVQAVDWRGSGPMEELNKAVAPYNAAFDRLRGQGDALLKATADRWGRERSLQFQDLVDEALAVHARLKGLNDLKDLVNACQARQPACDDRAATRARVSTGVDAITAEVDGRLATFGAHRRAFLEAENEELFQAAPAPPAGTPRGTQP